MSPSEWVKLNLEWHGKCLTSEYIDKFLEELRVVGADISRSEFWNLYDKIYEKVDWSDPSRADFYYLRINLLFSDDYYRVWGHKKENFLPEIKPEVRFKNTVLDENFIRIGGVCSLDDTVDNPMPICHSCGEDMVSLVEVDSLSHEIRKKHPELKRFIFQDMGRVALICCPECAKFEVRSMTH